jgi:hypothetical protein
VREGGQALLPSSGGGQLRHREDGDGDAIVAAFHARAVKDRNRMLIVGDFVLALKRPEVGAVLRLMPVAFGPRHDGKKEVIDFRLILSESATEWERFFDERIRSSLI